MRHAILLCSLLALPAFADDKPKPNTLTAKEIADGWILLFDGETTFGWKVEGEAKVKEGILHVGGKEAATVSTTTTFGLADLKFDYSASGKTEMDILGIEHKIYFPPKRTDPFTWQTAVVERDSWLWAVSKIFDDSAYREGSPVREQRLDNASLPDSPIPQAVIRFKVAADAQLNLSSIKLKPYSPKPLFNAKDLTGWKEFQSTKDKKVASKFTVTKEGWLNVKNGPGDLQTEGQWADFVLQFDCISNGKYCNSGMFFRCIPDVYQQGYEAQIRNEWMADDRSKPVDFGTGAIYRRQAARKVVSTDGEWFTMTVAAHGRHLATWVNGYQVTDWTDDRKENDNARNGFKKGKGALSIQGHDPTTDLSFRNIRIQSLDPK
jgi:hypothetical protein